LHRVVYGAFDPGPPSSLLVASAASLVIATLLQKTFAPVARSQGQTLKVRDLAPLPSSDSSGVTSTSAVLSLIIAGILGSSVVYLVTQHRRRAVRLAALVSLGIGAGLAAALATDVVVGAVSDHFLAIWGVATLFVLAVALPIAAFQALFGLPGTGIGLIVFLVIGNPASGGSTAPELLPGFWRAVSQNLPPGAGTTAMHDVIYFHGHGATRGLIVLATYAIVGAIGAMTLHKLGDSAEPAAAPSAEPAAAST
jgi:hypothetical protein